MGQTASPGAGAGTGVADNSLRVAGGSPSAASGCGASRLLPRDDFGFGLPRSPQPAQLSRICGVIVPIDVALSKLPDAAAMAIVDGSTTRWHGFQHSMSSAFIWTRFW